MVYNQQIEEVKHTAYLPHP